MSSLDDPSLSEVLTGATDAALGRVYTVLPGQVESVNTTLGVCDVKPTLKRTAVDGSVKEYPVIVDVPIANYRAGQAFITLPVQVGDLVELRFCQRSLDIWKNKLGIVDPEDPRMFQLADALAYPGMYPPIDPPVGASSTDIVIKNKLGIINVSPLGKFSFTGGVYELMDLLSSTLGQLITVTDKLALATTNTSIGAQPLINAADYAAAKAELTTIKVGIDALKK